MKSEKAKHLIKQHPREPSLYYVVLDELPEDQRKPFGEWLYGQTMTVVEEEDFKYGKPMCTPYSWDYELWYDYWSKGEEAPVTD